ncbi:hypothetical protein [Vibrio chemaguriensis]
MKLGSVRVYAPEHWGTLEKFSRFYAHTYKLSNTGRRCVSGAQNHFHKANTLLHLANKLVPNLDLDDQELNEKGFSHAANANELSAVIESAMLELYSSVDCARKVVTEICQKEWKLQGVPDSTRKLFKKVRDGKMVADFPEQLELAITEASWYEEFRIIRDELTHQDTGNCHKDNDTGAISYMHTGITNQGRSLIIGDIFKFLDQIFKGVNQFLGRVFAYLYTTLSDEPVRQICGIFEGRAYTRFVRPSEAIDFNGGVCAVKDALALPENPNCAFMGNCKAFENAC